MEDIVKQFIILSRSGLPTRDYFLEHIGSNTSLLGQFHKEFIAQTEALASKKDYIYMITFTLKPSYDGPDEEVELFIEAQAERKALNIKKFVYVKEKTKKGVSHWHALVVTDKCLKKDRFNYYIKKYGNIDISRNKAQTDQEILNYLSKSGTPKQLL